MLERFKAKGHLRECLAEALGTFILVLLGTGSNAFVQLKQNGNFPLSATFGWAGAIFMAVSMSFGVSGAHLNPAVSVTFAIFKNFPWNKVLGYSLAQLIGAFFGSLVVFYDYQNLISLYSPDGKLHTPPELFSTSGIFATYKDDSITNTQAFFDQVLGTAILLGGLFCFGDQRNYPVHKKLIPLSVGILLFMIINAFGLNCGAALNPARDLGPRIMTAMVGYGDAVFVNENYFCWIPIIGPFIGGIVGALFYIVLIERNHPTDEEKQKGYDLQDVSNLTNEQ